jgi:TRAP-type mannitol/chloroaromatic compound transport system permease large subunit
MSAILVEYMAPIMFGALVIFLLIGYPVAFALAANGLLFGFIGIKLGLLTPELFQALPERVWGVMSNDTLLAVPFFTFMGLILERSGMAEDLLDTVGRLFGPVRGGLSYAVIFVGALLAATTGVVAASVIAMGLISLPIMLRYGYDRRIATGTIAASGTLAQIIPPSLVLIVLADQLGRSVGDMYQGAFIPGFILTGLYMLYTLAMSLVTPKALPATPPEARSFGEGAEYSRVLAASALPLLLLVWGMFILFDPEDGLVPFAPLGRAVGGRFQTWLLDPNTGSVVALVVLAVVYYVYVGLVALRSRPVSLAVRRVIGALLPPLVLIFLVLGTIFRGIATPTEGGAMGAVGALVLAAMNRRLSFDLLRQAMDKTAKLATFVVFILLGARVFSLTFYGVNGHVWVEHLLLGLPGGATGFLIVVNLLVFVLAFFLDFFELAFIIVPLLAPVAEKLGIDLIWFGVMLGVNMQTSFMHPPFGFALFYLRSVAPTENYRDRVTGRLVERVTTGQIYMGAIPYVVIQLVMVGLVIAFPAIVKYQKAVTVDPSKVRIEVPLPGLPGSGGEGGGIPGLPPLRLPGQ